MDNPHTKSVIYGLMSLIGIVGFLIFERVLTIISDLCSQNSHKSAKVIPIQIKLFSRTKTKLLIVFYRLVAAQDLPVISCPIII